MPERFRGDRNGALYKSTFFTFFSCDVASVMDIVPMIADLFAAADQSLFKRMLMQIEPTSVTIYVVIITININ